MKSELELRKAICEVGKRLYLKNLVAATDGNISIKLGPDRFLCTPSAVCKADMAPNDILVADGRGQKIAGSGKVTSEFFTHLAAYEERPEMNAVVHAHPPKAIGFTLAGISMVECVLPELVNTIGGIPTTAYATPATKEGGGVVREYIRQCDALLMDRHGALTVGKDVWDAYYKMEKIEHAAETLLTARLLGEVRTLSPDEIEKLQAVREAYGISTKAYPCASQTCTCGGSSPTPQPSPEIERIVAETLRLLGHN